MATIPRAALDYLTEQVRGLVADAKEKVSRLLESIEWRPDNIAECREALLDALFSTMPAYIDAAAQAGADFYDAVRVREVGEAAGALAIGGFDPEAFEGAVRAFVQDMVDGKPVELFNGKVVDRVDRDIRRSANMSVSENARRDQLKPKYARVPSGGETCEFCIMLASRGAVYGTEEAASHAHPGCDCRVVPSFGDGSEIEGYDPDEYYELWKSGVLKKEESIRKSFNREWAKFQKDGTEQAYFSTVGQYIRSFSDEGLMDCEFRAKPLAKELMTAAALAKNGHRVRFLPETGGYGEKNPDCILDNEFIYDFKRVESGNPNKIFQNVRRSSAQTDRFVIDLVISKMSIEDALAVASEAVLSSDTSAVEILILHADGSEKVVR
ncbi:hypothetical protein [uncultured Slackia sp.]|uniref:VG15 protein n=1 Tax=uncultured Slackia sp. TaxID=665903 RepID=UPI0026E10506|nr:hypothetical protein [uncultured Slackia sp.]